MEQTDKDNRLVAEFMGGEHQPDWVGHRELQYHTSWDWLMPVVEKVNTICNERGFLLSNRSKEQVHLPDPLGNPLHWKSWSYHRISLSTDRTMVFGQVVRFIKWYNAHKVIKELKANQSSQQDLKTKP